MCINPYKNKIYRKIKMSDETVHCNTCNLDFKNEKFYIKHANTSRHILRATNSDIITFSCVCGKTYSYNQSLYVHRKQCVQYQKLKTENLTQFESVSLQVEQLQKEKKEMREKLMSYEKEHENLKVQIAKEREEMKAQIAMLLDKQASPSPATNNNNSKIENQTNNNITININAFGNENTDYIDNKAILSCISKVYKSIPSLLEKIHFDPIHPENHNIKITNKKLPYASVMGNNQKWKTVDRKDAIETMVINGYNMLDEKYSETKEKLSISKQQNFESFQSKFESEDKNLMKQIKTEVDMMILNGGG